MRKRVLIIAGAVIGLVVVAYVAISVYVFNETATVEAKCAERQSEANYTPADFKQPPDHNYKPLDLTPYLMPGYQDVSFPSRDSQITISAFYVEARGVDPSTAPAVILVHGFSDCKRRAFILTPAGMLNIRGFNVLLIDMRNHGDSTVTNGHMAAGGVEYQDVLGAWDWLVQEKNIPENRIGLMGFSLGGATVMIAAGEEPRVAAVWEDSGFASMDEVMRSGLKQNGYPDFLEPGAVEAGKLFYGDDLLKLLAAQEVTRLGSRPLFIVHSDADQLVSVSHANDLAAIIKAHGGNVTLWITSGAKHVESIWDYPDQYEDKLVAFFTESLSR